MTVATPMPTPRPSVIGRCDGDTHTAATPRSVASSHSDRTSALVASGARRVWSITAASMARSIGCHHAPMQVTVVDHPLAAQLLTRLRDEGTDRAGFRRAMDDLSGILVYEASRDIEAVPVAITTPVGPTT